MTYRTILPARRASLLWSDMPHCAPTACSCSGGPCCHSGSSTLTTATMCGAESRAAILPAANNVPNCSLLLTAKLIRVQTLDSRAGRSCKILFFSAGAFLLPPSSNCLKLPYLRFTELRRGSCRKYSSTFYAIELSCLKFVANLKTLRLTTHPTVIS